MRLDIPQTTAEEPYIKFRIDKIGKLTLSTTSSWHGGKCGGFFDSKGGEGNSCEPKHLKLYLQSFKQKKIKSLEKEITSLQKTLEKTKLEMSNWDF